MESLPHITLPLVDKAAIDGKSVKLECCLTSQGPMDITWYKGTEQAAETLHFTLKLLN